MTCVAAASSPEVGELKAPAVGLWQVNYEDKLTKYSL